MQIRLISIIFVISLLSAGCVAPPTAPAMQAKIDEIQRTIPTCSSERECNEKWEMAQLWVVNNAGYKIQNATNVLIQTYNATGSSMKLAMQVTKEPQGGGRYRFNLKVWCDNMFGCSPNKLEAILDFNRTLNRVQS